MRIGLWKPLFRPANLNRPFRAQYLGFESIVAYLRSVAPHHEIVYTTKDVDLIGISCVSETHHLVKAVCRGLRRGGFAGLIILGGPHYTALPGTMPFEADCCVIGPGEETFAELVAAYAKDGVPDFSEIQGVAFRDPYGLIQQTQRRDPLPLDDLPVAIEAVPDDWMQISTIRGCPYRCEHCVEHTNQGKVRWLSAERLVWIMEERVRLTGNNSFFFQDDTFLAAKGRLEKMHALMAKRNLFGKFKIQMISMNANLVEEHTIPMLKDIGAVSIGMGAESWDPRVLRAMKRNVVTREHLMRTLDYAEKADMLPVGGSLVVGYPGETAGELATSLDTARQLSDQGRLSVWGTYVCQPLPGSRLWQRLESQGKVSVAMDFSTLRIDACSAHFESEWAYWNEDEVSREELKRVVKASGFTRKGCVE